MFNGSDEAQLKFREHSEHSVVDVYDDLVVPLAFPRDLGSWDDERTREMPCPRNTTFQSEKQIFISAVQGSIALP